MKFLADMGISLKTVLFLRGLMYDSVHLHEQGLDKLPDPNILEKARNEGRVLLTHDLDFGELVAAAGAKLPSVIIFRLRNMNPEQVNDHLQGIIAQHQEILKQGAVVSVTEVQVRVRSLPVRTDE